MNYFLTAENICKSFEKTEALSNITLQIKKGDIFGVIGPNGAGKTTFLRIIAGILKPDKGQISFDLNIPKNKISYLPEEKGLYRDMKVLEEVLFFGNIKGLKRNEITINYTLLSDIFKFRENDNTYVSTLSKGNLQKLLLIITFLNNPDLMILDEPFSGLDAISTDSLENYFKKLQSEGKTIILSSHNMEHAERLCGDICLINKGSIILKGSLDNIKKDRRKNIYILNYRGNLSSIISNEIDIIEDDGKNAVIEILNNDAGKIIKSMFDKIEIESFSHKDISLREIFIDKVKNV